MDDLFRAQKENMGKGMDFHMWIEQLCKNTLQHFVSTLSIFDNNVFCA